MAAGLAQRSLRRGLNLDPWLIAALALGLVLFGLVVVPQIWLGRASLLAHDGRTVTLDNLVRFFTLARYRSALLNSVVASLLTTVAACLVAVPLAFVHARYRLPGQQTLLTLATMATVSPPFLGAYVWMMLLGWSGWVSVFLRSVGIPFESIVGMPGIIWVGTWGSFGLVFLLAHDAFSNMDPSLEEAAMSVGASRLRTYLQVSLPLATPALLTAAYMVLMGAFSDFGTPKIIGGEVRVLPVLVYSEFLSEVQTNPSMASAASVVMVAISTAILVLQRAFLARRSYALAGVHRAARRPVRRWVAALAMLWTGAVLALVFTPHLVMVALSFVPWQSGIPEKALTLANYRDLLQSSLAPVYISYFLSVVSTLLDVIAGVMLAYIIVRKSYRALTPALSGMVMIPYVISGTVLAIGLIMAFNRQPLLLTGTWVILCLSYSVRKLPYAMKSAEAALYQVHPSLEEAGLSVGAAPLQVFRDITVRMILPGVLSGGTMSFLMIITELSSTIMLYSATWTTMSVVIFQAALGIGSQFGLAASTSVVMLVSVYVPLYLLRRHVRVEVGVS